MHMHSMVVLSHNPSIFHASHPLALGFASGCPPLGFSLRYLTLLAVRNLLDGVPSSFLFHRLPSSIKGKPNHCMSSRFNFSFDYLVLNFIISCFCLRFCLVRFICR